MADLGAKDGLQPTRFQPTEQKARIGLRLPPWWQWVLLAVALSIAVIGWFLITATAVRFQSNAEQTGYEISGGIVVPSGPSYLIRQGEYNIRATAEGYKPLRQQFTVLAQPNQIVELELAPRPGRVTIDGTPENAMVDLYGENLGTAPLTTELPAGPIRLSITSPRYQSTELVQEVIGREVEQTFEYTLRPNFAMVNIPTTPTGAPVLIDDQETSFRTPGPIEVMAGERKISLKVPGYERWNDIIYVRAEETVNMMHVSLKHIGGTLYVASSPNGASVSINGNYVGTTPVDIDLEPNRNHRVEASLFGYQTLVRNVRIETAQERRVFLSLVEVTGKLAVTTQPEKAEIWVDGGFAGTSNAILTLHATDHSIELRKNGYAGYQGEVKIQSEFNQELKVKLLTNEEARLEALKQVRTTSENHELLLLKPGPIRLGASRRQPGRRSNEVFHNVALERLIYLSKNEVTNTQFRRFATGHDSGSFENVSLNKDEQPVVNVSWWEAALYCNWLSTKEGFEPFYMLRPGDPAKYNANSLGYRLPTEAEWVWTARTTTASAELLHFPWGENLTPPNYHGNYADLAAQHVIGRIIFNFNDNHTVSAPVGTYATNYHGLNDIGGNVAEWVHNFYAIPTVDATVSNLGPESGEYHVIRGSSWMHGTITDLRLSFRDYGTDGRRDVGFRLARFAE